MKNILLTGFASIIILSSCNKNNNEFDASGVFEATEVIVSAESSGQILQLMFQEGDVLTKGQTIGNIDCENMELQKAQAEASLEALNAKTNSAQPQVEILKEQLNSQSKNIEAQKVQLAVLHKEENRISNLVKAEAIPTQQLDEISGKVSVLQKQIEASESLLRVTQQQISSQKQQISIANRAILSERKPMEQKIAQMNNLIGNCTIINPVNGTVLVKYVENAEMTAPGKALYKIADMQELILRAYISGSQIPKVKVNDTVKVFVDNGEEGYKEMQGKVSWISSKAEFTPKTIQTKDERANLVYATKVTVKNDGYLKIGMYGEIKFQ